MLFKKLIKKEYFLLSTLIFFHIINNLFFLRQDTHLLFIGTPHYFLNTHLKMVLNIIPLQENDLLALSSFLLSSIFGGSLLVLRLVPSIAFSGLLIAVYCLVSFLFLDKKTGLLAAFLVSFAPGNIFYARLYSHQMFFIALIYFVMYALLRFFLKGRLAHFIFYMLVLYAGSSMLKEDTSLELIFLLYSGCPLIFLLRYAFKNKKWLQRYSFLLLFFLLILARNIFLLPGDRNITAYLIPEAFKRFPYPVAISEWVYFLSYYAGEIANSIYMVPLVVFVLMFSHIIFLPEEKKIFQGIKAVDFLGSLFLLFWFLNLLGKKLIFYVSPLISLVLIITAAGIMLISNKQLKKAIIYLLVTVNIICFFSFSLGYNVAYLSGESLFKDYNAQVMKYGELEAGSIIGLCNNLSAPGQDIAKNYVKTKQNVYAKIGSAENFALALQDLNLEKILAANIGEWSSFLKIAAADKLRDKELAVLEYISENRIAYQS